MSPVPGKGLWQLLWQTLPCIPSCIEAAMAPWYQARGDTSAVDRQQASRSEAWMQHIADHLVQSSHQNRRMPALRLAALSRTAGGAIKALMQLIPL